MRSDYWKKSYGWNDEVSNKFWVAYEQAIRNKFSVDFKETDASFFFFFLMAMDLQV